MGMSARISVSNMPLGIKIITSGSIALLPLLLLLLSQQLTVAVATKAQLSLANIDTNKTQDHHVEQRADRNPEVERVKKQGQLESFSMEATGLGDLEEADAIRIMMRRSRAHQAHIKSIKRDLLQRQRPYAAADAAGARIGLGDGAPAQSRRAQSAAAAAAAAAAPDSRYYERFLRSLLKRRAAMPPREEDSVEILPPYHGRNEETQQPIAITRRTVEELIGDEEQQGEQLDDKTQGEFGSRISLLTTRKIQPDELLVQDPVALANLLNYELFRSETRARTLDGASEPLRMRNELLVRLLGAANDRAAMNPERESYLANSGSRAPSGEQPPILIGTDSNFLPRVARGFYM